MAHFIPATGQMPICTNDDFTKCARQKKIYEKKLKCEELSIIRQWGMDRINKVSMTNHITSFSNAITELSNGNENGHHF